MPSPELWVTRRQPTEEGAGAGRLLVLVHGTMDRGSSFTRLMARLPDWTVLTYDRRGYGRSGHLGPPGTFAEQVDDLVGVLDGQPAFAFGHSLGGDIVLAAAERHPDLLPAVMAWEPPQPWTDWWPRDTANVALFSEMDPAERAEWFMRRMVGDRVWERLPSATKAQRREEGRTLQADIASISVGPVFTAADIRVPVTIGRGGRSQPHQRRGARELVASLRDGRLVEIPESDHGAHLSHPGELARLIVEAVAPAG